MSPVGPLLTAVGASASSSCTSSAVIGCAGCEKRPPRATPTAATLAATAIAAASTHPVTMYFVLMVASLPEPGITAC